MPGHRRQLRRAAGVQGPGLPEDQRHGTAPATQQDVPPAPDGQEAPQERLDDGAGQWHERRPEALQLFLTDVIVQNNQTHPGFR